MIGCVIAIVLAFVLGAGLTMWLQRDDWPSRVRQVCEQYAPLDLAGLAPLCVDAGYQQATTPEDLGR